MKPGFYILTKTVLLTEEDLKPSYRLRLHKGDWLVTDGYSLGRFDKDEELDWVPLQWVPGVFTVLSENIVAQLEPVVVQVPLSRLEAGWKTFLFVEPGEPMPDFPRPVLSQLWGYLRERRASEVYSYRR